MMSGLWRLLPAAFFPISPAPARADDAALETTGIRE
jgi:hypothetical protein